MSRKFRHNGSTSFELSRTKKYKYNTSGNLEVVVGTPSDDDFVFSGSKSSLRRIGDLERNVSILIAQANGDGGTTNSNSGWTSFASSSYGDARFYDDVQIDDDLRVDGDLDLRGSLHSNAVTVMKTSLLGASNDVFASTDYVDGKITDVVGTAPAALDTLQEIAAVLGNSADVTGSIITNLNGKLDASSYTASDVLTKLKTVDGAGSGLDADTLDGLTSGAFLRSNANDTHSGHITPNANNTINLGSSALKYANVYATTFQGVSTTAKYADLAERYAADAPYEAGTVLAFGGEAEVTASTSYAQRSLAGVISTDPAFKMNSEAGNSQTHPYVALQGRVPCKVIGEVKKGDILVASATPGYACAWTDENNDPRMTAYVGIAIEDKTTEGAALIEIKVGK